MANWEGFEVKALFTFWHSFTTMGTFPAVFLNIIPERNFTTPRIFAPYQSLGIPSLQVRHFHLLLRF